MEEHTTLSDSNLDGAGWALTSDGIHFVAIFPFEKISPRSTITMELAGRLLVNGKEMAEYFPSEALCGYVKQVLKVSETEGKLDIAANIDGGGGRC